MNKIDYQDLNLFIVEYSSKIKNLDFIARVMTPWHLIGLASYLSVLSNELSRDIYGIVLIIEHGIDGFLLKEEDIIFDEKISHNTMILGSSSIDQKIYRILNLMFRRKNEIRRSSIYIISPSEKWTLLEAELNNMGFQPISVIIDEGVGSYNGGLHWIRNTYMETKSLLKVIVNLVQITMTKLLNIMYKNPLIYFTLFSKKGKTIKKNDQIIQQYSETLVKLYKYAKPISLFGISLTEGRYAILFTQPFINDDSISEKRMERIYSKIGEILNNNGIQLLVKIHPRDKFGLSVHSSFFQVIKNKNISAEELFINLEVKPVLAISFWSTVLVSLNLFFSVPTISLNNIYINELSSKFTKKSMKKFHRNFNELVDFPASLNELESSIKKFNI